MLFYVRRHTGADGSLEWYVLNGHTRWRARKFFPTRAAAAAERAKLQVKLDLPKGASPQANAERLRDARCSDRCSGRLPLGEMRKSAGSKPRGAGPPASYPSSPPGYPTEGEGELAGRAVSQRVGGGTAQRTWPGKRNLTCEPSRWLLCRKRRGAQTKAPPVRAGLCN